MATRGFIGFKENGNIKGWYNHSDSYYSHLGLKMLEKFRNHGLEELRGFFGILELVDDEEYYDNYRTVLDEDWAYAVVILVDNSSFIEDGLYCEYGYVFDIDKDILEIYRGGFYKPRYENQNPYTSYDGTKYYVNKVFEVYRDNNYMDFIEELFKESYPNDRLKGKDNLLEVYDSPLWEEEYIKEHFDFKYLI